MERSASALGDMTHNRAMMEYDAARKSALLAYVLWFFLGFLGAHRLYANRVPSGLLQLVLHGFGWLTAAIVVGYIFLALWAAWWLIDALLIPGWIREHNMALARRLT